jgi:hypothetical protein
MSSRAESVYGKIDGLDVTRDEPTGHHTAFGVGY